jgi:hypothetical protein
MKNRTAERSIKHDGDVRGGRMVNGGAFKSGCRLINANTFLISKAGILIVV